MTKIIKSLHELNERKLKLTARKKELESLIKNDFQSLQNHLTINHLVDVAIDSIKKPNETNVFRRSIIKLSGWYAEKKSKDMMTKFEKWMSSFFKK
jgi:hypothetical protein